MDKVINCIDNHIFKEGVYFNSPYQSSRPNDEAASLIVLHSISLPYGQFGTDYVYQLFMGELETDDHESFTSLKELKVSVHIFIRRDGSAIQFVPFNKCAWHAGISNYKGRENCNDFSIGIELEGSKEFPYTKAQYKLLARLCICLIDKYEPLTQQTIIGHKDIAIPRGRKDDPWNFDWNVHKRYMQENTSMA